MTVTENEKTAVELVTLTIDDIEVSVPKGTLVIRAAEEIGIAIPRFCDHPLLAPAGACRQCLVEISTPGPDGSLRAMPKPQASCTIEASKGMVVRTQLTSEVAEKAQHGVMELLLINHPLDCPICDKGGECPLQNQAMANGQATSRFTETKRTFPKPIRISTQVLLDRERCVLCQRCTRFSKEIAGDPFIDLQMRGAQQQIGTFSPGVLGFSVSPAGPERGADLETDHVVAAPSDTNPRLEPAPVSETQGLVTDESRGASADPATTHKVNDYSSDSLAGAQTTTGEALIDESGQPFASYFSGNTVQICPVGALTGAAYRFRSRPFDLVSTPSVCEHCSSGCALRVDHRRGAVMRRLAADDPAVNEEWNCDKGRWAFPWQTASDRLETPLVRDEDGVLQPASWPEAIDAAARGLAGAMSPASNGGVGVLTGGRLTVEDAYAYAKFARVALRTNDIDFRARPASAEEAEFLAAVVAGRGMGVTFADLERAPAVLFAGLEPEEEAASVFLRLRKAVNAHGTPIFSLASWASRGLVKLGGQLLPTVPGHEADVLAALTKGDTDERLAAATAGLKLPGAVILVGSRLATVPGGLAQALRLAEATGARIAWVPTRAGERGAVEAGALPGLLPGGRPLADAAARVDVAATWGVESLPVVPGRDGDTMLGALIDGSLGALVIGGVDPDDLPDPERARQALAAARFVVSLEVRASAVTEHADVVFPVAPPAEKTGTYVNWEGRWRPFPTVLRTNAQADHRVLESIADALDAPLGLRSVEAVRREIEEFGAWEGARAPVPLAAAHSRPPADAPAEGVVLDTWPLLLGQGRLQDGEPYLAGTAHRAVARLSRATASALGVLDAPEVSVSTERGTVTVPLQIAPVVDGVVWLPANSARSAVRATLGAGAGTVVRVGAADTALLKEGAGA